MKLLHTIGQTIARVLNCEGCAMRREAMKQMYTTAKAAWEADGDVFPFTQAQVTNALSKCFVNAGANDSEDDMPMEPVAFVASKGLQLIQGQIV